MFGDVGLFIPSSICDLRFKLSTSFIIFTVSAGGPDTFFDFLCKLDPGELDVDLFCKLNRGAGTGVPWVGGGGAGLFFLYNLVLLVDGDGETLAFETSSSDEKSPC